MNKKKKIIAVIVSVILALAISGTAVYLYVMRYAKDKNDTEELYRENVSAVAYENTIETAIPQTSLYEIVNNHFRSELPKGKTEKKAIIIGYDGCRADVLTEIQAENSGINSLLKAGASLKLTYCGGVNYPEVNTQDTSTAPGWCSILTGQWADVHGITGNDITKSLDTKTLMTSLTEDKIIDSATFITRWKGHFSRDNATYLLEKEYCEENNLNVAFNHCKNNDVSHETLLGDISQQECSDFLFVIYEHTDSTGHSYGFTHNNPDYRKAFTDSEVCAYEAIETIKNRASYDSEDWLIIITSDHGGVGTGHGKASIQERMTFAVINKEF